MRGFIRVFLEGLDIKKKKIKKGRGLNVTFNRNGNYAVLITKTGNEIKQKKVVPLEKIPGSYKRHEFVDMYPPEQAQLQPQTMTVNIVTQSEETPVTTGQSKFCANCGASVRSDAKFCESCGSEL
ncbi:MAG TPA: zinc ribbon domain-containing protein [Candidatus Lokiarchaeia archaeon]|nr:zinc ribbon domain-containing protein [Candidatus Lokiarchaeia archaeon]